MKRILTVLVLLAVCGMAYSVTGKVFTQMDKDGISLGDTGTDMNFDGFTFTYKLSPTYTAIANTNDLFLLQWGYDGAVVTSTNSLAATTPGYFQISGVKLGDALTVGTDFKWYTLGLTTNVNTTNLDASISYNEVLIQPKVVYVVNDTTTVTADWGNDGNGYGKNLTFFVYGGSSSRKTVAGVTNTASVSGSQFGVPVKINTKVGDLAIEVYPYFYLANYSSSLIMSANTNTFGYSKAFWGAYLQGTYPLNDTMKAQGKVSLDSTSSSEKDVTNNNVTNVYTSSAMPLGLFGELIWAVAPQTTLNLGLGYKVQMANTATSILNNATNVTVETQPGLVGYDPFIVFGGTTKFAENWTLGINGRMQYAPTSTANTVTTSSTTNVTTSASAVKFDSSGVNWDLGDNAKSIFLQYDIDAVSIRFAITSAGQGVFNAGRLNLSYTY